MDEPELTQRLRDLGKAPVPDDVQSRHVRMMTSVKPAGRQKRFGRLAVAGAAVVGFAFGSTGLAMAGALPAPAQDVAHDVLSVIQVDVPEGTRGQCVSQAAKSNGTEEEKKAAKDACPKGGPPDGVDRGRSGEAPGRAGTARGFDKHADDPCRGKPPWAGNDELTDAERTAMQDARAACPPDDDGAEVEVEAPG